MWDEWDDNPQDYEVELRHHESKTPLIEKALAESSQACPFTQEGEDDDHPWEDWWMRLGGVEDYNTADDKGWLPLHHAADARSLSLLRSKAPPPPQAPIRRPSHPPPPTDAHRHV